MTAPALTPVEAKVVADLPKEPGWQFEPKWDGLRASLCRNGIGIETLSKSGKSLTRHSPEIVALVTGIDQARPPSWPRSIDEPLLQSFPLGRDQPWPEP